MELLLDVLDFHPRIEGKAKTRKWATSTTHMAMALPAMHRSGRCIGVVQLRDPRPAICSIAILDKQRR
jgi:hypothetical protein